ncbi:glycoside hydrolase family 95 protein [Streptomyces sp. NBC_01622]|uniref:glycoside hydrolase family 95 protein n=1 Tax=Streptomyces sp. NBC_01622 TaxID=2975903 RepID=UPI00386ED094|nr:glycoside hydrolase family 95 protein [Streptomyces sp. NBC_01622]
MAPSPGTAGREHRLRLFYDKPAEQWLEALPVGNGRLGAMVFGGVRTERLQLNEDTLWAGGPYDPANAEALRALPRIRELVFTGQWQRAQDLIDASCLGDPVGELMYQPVGDLRLGFAVHPAVTDYERELDLDQAVARTSFTAGDVRHTREVIASAPDQVVAVRLTADRPGAVSFRARFDSPQRYEVSCSGTDLVVAGRSGDAEGIAGQVLFRTLVRAMGEGGTVNSRDGVLTVTGADAVTLLVSTATSYVDYRDTSADPAVRASHHLAAAAELSWQTLLRRHREDYQRLFHRVSIDLGGGGTAALPTDQRVALFRDDDDPQLAALYYQYARYLLISCSRPGTQPANLQGIWNDSMTPAWGSKYTININTQMNYWPADPANLSECFEPLCDLVTDLAEAGRRTAAVQYGARGWVAHHNTDAWRGTSMVDSALTGAWPSGGAWLSVMLWDHYLFTGDEDALRRHYPLIKGAARFFLDTLAEYPGHGWLVTNPSISPEMPHHRELNTTVCAGPTMDTQLLRDLFAACTQAAAIVGRDHEDGAFLAEVSAARARLAPMRVGHLGQLQEWIEDWDALAETNHRHVSHLYGLHPGNQITERDTPELCRAARRTLELRGDDGTGWSLAWKINLWARLAEGDRAYKLLADQLTPRHTAPNLFDLHPPFQIDGNFGAVSGITEMLLQSHAGEVHLLPALPTRWPHGSVRGLRARGGLEIDLSWHGGRLRRAVLRAARRGEIRLRTADPVTVHGPYGQLRLSRPEPSVVVFLPEPGAEYRIDCS